MKLFPKRVAAAFLSLGLAGLQTANGAPVADRTGLSGELTPLVGVVSSRSNLAVSSDHKRIDSLYSLSSRETRAIGGVFGRVDYTLVPRRLSLYAGTPRSARATRSLASGCSPRR